MKPMRILALMPGLYDTSPGQRYRLEQWDPLLRQRGVEITYAPFEDSELHSIVYKPGQLGKKLQLVTRNLARRLSTIGEAKNYDLVYVFREAALLGPPIFERLIAQQRTPFVLDRKSTRLNSSHSQISYAVFCLKKKKKKKKLIS